MYLWQRLRLDSFTFSPAPFARKYVYPFYEKDNNPFVLFTSLQLSKTKLLACAIVWKWKGRTILVLVLLIRP